MTPLSIATSCSPFTSPASPQQNPAAPLPFNDVARLAAHLCGAAFGVVSVLDGDMVVACGCHGLDGQPVRAEDSLCDLVIGGRDDTLVVEDASADSRMAHHPMVTSGLKIRFFAGAKLRSSDGSVLGSVCVLDPRSRPSAPEAVEFLRTLAAQVAAQFDLRHSLEMVKASSRELTDLFENSSVGIHRVSKDGLVLAANRTELRLLGYTANEYVGRHIGEFHADPPVIAEILQRLAAGETLRSFPARLRHKDGSIRHVVIDSSVLFDEGRFVHTRCFTRDVTAQRETEEKFRLMVENVRDYAVLMLDLEGRVVSWNVGAQRISGYEAHEILGRHVSVFLPSESVQAGLPMLEMEGARMHGRFENEGWRVHKSGRQFWAHVVVTPIRADAGRLLGYAKVVRDLSEWKRAQDLLVESEQRFRLMADSAPVLIWTSDVDRSWDYVNHSWLEFTGRSLDQLRGGGWLTCLHPDDRDTVLAAYLAAFDGRRRFALEYRLLRQDGEYRWMLDTGVPRHDRTGTFCGYIGCCLDITERKAAEEGLRRTSAEIRDLYDNAPCAYHSLGPDGTILNINETELRWLGYRRDEVVGRMKFSDLLPPDARPRFYELFPRVTVPGGSVEGLEFDMMRRDGVALPVLLNSVPVHGPDGALIHTRSTMFDNRARRQAETARQQSEAALRESLREKEVLLREVHHRVKNNLQVISSLMEMQARQIASPEAIAHFRDSQTRVRSMALIHEKLYQGDNLARVEFADYVRSLVPTIVDSYLRGADRVSVRLDLQPTPLDVSVAVPLGLILNELLTNAFKHAFPGDRAGVIELRLGRTASGALLLGVRDNGIGFSPNVDRDRTETLGLRLVRMLARQIHARLHWLPEPDTGIEIAFDQRGNPSAVTA
jgi:PAS domain S-box-containing protein